MDITTAIWNLAKHWNSQGNQGFPLLTVAVGFSISIRISYFTTFLEFFT
jgi:hypothetical protein